MIKMPRSYLCGDEGYKTKDFCHQVSLIAKERKINQAMLGEALGVTQARMSQKLKTGDLNLEDLFKLVRILSMKVVMEEGRIRIERISEDGFNICNHMEY